MNCCCLPPAFEEGQNRNFINKSERGGMFSVGVLLQRLVIAVFFVGVIAGLCWYDENIKQQVLSLKIEALIFLAGR